MALQIIVLQNYLARRHLRYERVFRDRTCPLEIYDDVDLYRRCCFTRQGIEYLIGLLSDDISPPTLRSYSIPASLQVFIALRYLSTGSMQLTISDTVSVSQSSVSRIVRRFVRFLCSRLTRYIYMPTDEELPTIKRKFYQISRFPNVMATIDGTHIRILAPSEHKEVYVNRKGFHSLNVMVVMDANYIIRYVASQWPGSTHDSRELQMSRLWGQLNNNPNRGVILGDSGYPNRNFLLTPLPASNTEPQGQYNR